MIEAVILYVLDRYDATIYRIARIIDELFFAYLKSSAGTINPALKRLEKLGCVQYTEKMSDGGMLSKIYSITPEGKKHLKELLLSFKELNPYHVVNTSKIAMFCSDILSVTEYNEFKENILNNLELHKIKLQNGLKNEYITLKEQQKKSIEITIEEVEKLIKIL